MIALDPIQPRPGVGAPGRPEQPLEDGARIVLDRQRRRRRAPRDRVRIGAARAAVAGAEHRVRFDPELERRQLRLLRELRRGDLIHRHRREHVGPRGDLERHAGQERAGGSRVIAAALHQVRGFVGQPAAEQHPVAVLRERRQRRRQVANRTLGSSATSTASTCRWARRTRPAAGPAPRRSVEAVSAGTMLSSSGSAIVAPRPRSIVRREICSFADEHRSNASNPEIPRS